MAEAKYNAIRIATQLCYSENVIEKIKNATKKAKSHGFYAQQERRNCNAKGNHISCI